MEANDIGGLVFNLGIGLVNVKLQARRLELRTLPESIYGGMTTPRSRAIR